MYVDGSIYSLIQKFALPLYDFMAQNRPQILEEDDSSKMTTKNLILKISTKSVLQYIHIVKVMLSL